MNPSPEAAARDAALVAGDVPDTLPEHERKVLEALRALQYGTLEITVHQSRIVQITRSEKVRF